MKKIMFNDRYDLTQAVLDGRKTMTRRLLPPKIIDGYMNCVKIDCEMINCGLKPSDLRFSDFCIHQARFYKGYTIGEVVAVAQSYESMANGGYIDIMLDENNRFKAEFCGAGYTNKMFAKPDLMPHQIKITDIKIESLQDISDEDCLKEGVFLDVTAPECYQPFYTFVNSKTKDNTPIGFINPKYAFQVLIDKVSGKGTWERNPWVFAYTFELVK